MAHKRNLYTEYLSLEVERTNLVEKLETISSIRAKLQATYNTTNKLRFLAADNLMKDEQRMVKNELRLVRREMQNMCKHLPTDIVDMLRMNRIVSQGLTAL